MIEYRLNSLPERLSEVLDEMGAFVAEEVFKDKVTYLVYASDNMDDFFSAFGVGFASKDVEETGWQEKWKEFIKEGWLCKSVYFIFEPKTFSDGRKTILINPAMAFGTGTHGTTRIAAGLLEPVCAGRTMLDIGTGSGVLSIAASIMGAEEVWAFDVDPAALANCAENIKNNGIKNIHAWAGDTFSIQKRARFDIVCANIISSVLLSIKDDVAIVADKYIIYSGLMESEFDEVITKLTPPGWRIDAVLSADGWMGARLINDSRDR